MTTFYPQFKFAEYSYQPPQLAKAASEQQPMSVAPQSIAVEKAVKVADIEKAEPSVKQICENLETPINSLPFLEIYHKSALKVEQLAGTLKSASYFMGVVSVICFLSAFLSIYGSSMT